MRAHHWKDQRGAEPTPQAASGAPDPDRRLQPEWRPSPHPLPAAESGKASRRQAFTPKGWAGLGRRVALAAAAGWLGACGGGPPVRVAVPFNPAEARARLTPGDNEIVGAAVMRLASGGVVSCAGEHVTLFPATAYAREWARLTYTTVEPSVFSPPGFAYRARKDGPAPVQTEQAFLNASRSVACDADGRFSIGQVGSGDYYAVARMAWQQPYWDRLKFFYGTEYFDLEGTVMQRVRLSSGERKTLNFQWTAQNTRYSLW